MSLERDLNRLLAEVCAADNKAAGRDIVSVHRDLIDSRSPRTREQIMSLLQDIIAELPD